MLNKSKSRKVAVLKYGLSVPLFAIMVVFSSATIAQLETVKTIAASTENSIPVVLDALSNGAIPVEPESQIILPGTPPMITLADSAALAQVWVHFAKSIRYAPSDQEMKKVGTNYLTFELDTTGAIRNPVVLISMSEGSKQEVLRVAKNAKPFGNGLEGKYILAITYALMEGRRKEIISAPEAFDFTKYKEYQKLRELTIRGYLPMVADPETPIDAVRKHFAERLNYPVEAAKNKAVGSVWLAFEIDNTGKILSPAVVQPSIASFEPEIRRVTALANPLGEGLQGKYILPILFSFTGVNGAESSVSLQAYRDYTRLTAVQVMGFFKANNPDSLITTNNWKVYSAYNNKFTWISSLEGNTVANYMVVDNLKNPIILVNGKVATYTVTKKGFKLDVTLYRTVPWIKVYYGEEAVKNYNESVRTKGLIVITTK
ncbi:MAG: hypothetical protein WKF66_16365 [Pedobacter sp.]